MAGVVGVVRARVRTVTRFRSVVGVTVFALTGNVQQHIANNALVCARVAASAYCKRLITLEG